VKVGKAFSLCLAVIIAVIATAGALAVMSVPSLASLSLVGKMAVLALSLTACLVIVLMPLGHVIDGSLAKLRQYVEDAIADQHGDTMSTARWLGPVTRAVSSAADQFRQREDALKNQLRDLEIRHRVSEAERRQIEAVLHALRDGVIVTDGFNELVMANRAAADVLGFPLDESMHKPIGDMIKDRRLCDLVSEVRESESVNSTRNVEHDITFTDAEGKKETAVYEVSLSGVANHKGDVAGVVMILHDMTRERELSEMKTDFVSKASHELRTPLSSIRAYVEMLVDGEADDEASRNEFYQIIHNETDRLGRLIDNMLNISRIEAGIVQIERINVDVKSLISRAVNTIEPQAKDKNISLSTRIADVGLSVEGDGDMLYQVVLNLMSNAVKYTPDGGRITVSADSDNLTRSVVVSIADTGLGIPPDALPRLFEKFYRVENYKRVAKGTGLGLSLCKHIVETVHRGQIDVESQLGMGSKFWFTVPMRYAGSQAAA
jgi:two-component system phosphate regulon sensor histidine kinase PhoR